MGKRLYLTYCMQCHGADARGAKGFPNLTDNDWLYGGNPEQIHQTLVAGRQGQMPPFGAALGEEKVKDLANYVMSLSGKKHDAERAARGKGDFTVCAACHGPDGKGNQGIGAPNLTDNIWLHGPGVEQHVTNMINNGKTGVMPAWESKFTPEQLKVLTAYVWGKGGGVAGATPAAAAPAAAAPAAAADNDAASVVVENGVVLVARRDAPAAVRAGVDALKAKGRADLL